MNPHRLHDLGKSLVFEWTYDVGGYAIRDGKLVPKGGKVVTYEPAKHAPDLLRDFLVLDRSAADAEARMLNFVGKYGLLHGHPPTLAEFWYQRSHLGAYADVADARFRPIAKDRKRARQPELQATDDQKLIDTFNTLAPQDMRYRMAIVRGRRVLHVTPGSLYTWMWWHLSDEMSLPRRNCRQCGQEFVVRNRKRQFCSDNCRYDFNHGRQPKI
jgi:hypothetical protein